MYSPFEAQILDIPPSPSNSLDLFVQHLVVPCNPCLASKTHSMMTRYKSVVFKPKVHVTNLSKSDILYDPRGYKEGLWIL